MAYFTPSFLKFFKDLSKNNTTEWFNENRKIYEKEVKKPFADFVDEMILRIQKHEPDVQIKASDAIMRINKDIRFSKDKTPYNTYVAANISAHGKKANSWPGFYFQFSHNGIMMYGGAYMVENEMLQKIRTYIAAHLMDFSKVLNEESFKEKFGEIQGEQNKRIPPEFQSVAEKEPLIANKQFFYSAEIKADIINTENLADTLMEYYQAGKKVNEFLKKAMGK